MNLDEKLYIVAYSDSGVVTGKDWYLDFSEATRQFNFAVENTERPGHAVTMYSGYTCRQRGETLEDVANRAELDKWREIGQWKDPRLALTPEDEALYRHAAGLLDSAEDVDPEKSEYVRGMVELIMSATGKNSDDKEDIARTLATFIR